MGFSELLNVWMPDRRAQEVNQEAVETTRIELGRTAELQTQKNSMRRHEGGMNDHSRSDAYTQMS